MNDELNLIIIEDEVHARSLLRSIIAELPGFRVIAECGDVDNAYALITEYEPDAILLDIRLSGKDGFVLVEMLRSLEKIPEVIFTTAHKEFAIKAIKAAAFDYLLKPVNKDELYVSLCRLREKIRQSRQKARMDQLVELLGQRNRLKLNDRHGFFLIDTAEIICIKADGNYSEIILSNDTKRVVTMNIGKLYSRLDTPNFIRISRSYVINKNFLVRIDRKNMICELQNETIYRCGISKNFLKNMEELL